MDMYITSKASGNRLRIPLLPDRISIRTSVNTVTYSIIKLGEARFPRGNALEAISWNGVFPGEGMQDASFVFDWQEPQKIIAMLKEWERNGEILNFMVTELSINIDAFIESFNYEYYGAGNADYTISLAQYRELSISTVPPPTVPSTGETETEEEEPEKQIGVVTGGSVYYRRGPGTSYKEYSTKHKGDKLEIIEKSGVWYKFVEPSVDDGFAWIHSKYIKLTSASSSNSTPTQSTPTTSESTYTVKKGDSLYSIAKKKLGSGPRYTEIYQLNKEAIDARNKGKGVSKYTIYTGMVLGIPAK